MQSAALLRAVHNPCQRREMTVSTNDGLVNGEVHNLLMQFFTPSSSKIEVFETCSFDIVNTRNDHPRYVKHVLGRVCVFFILFGGTGGGSQGIGTQPVNAVFQPGQLKIEVFESGFFDIVTTQNDHPRYLKHFLGRIYVFFTLFGYQVRGGGGGGSPRGLVHNLLVQFFTPDSSKIEVFETCFCDIVIT